jgi:inorganic pyrophosphatase
MHLVNDISAFVDQKKWLVNMVVDIPKGSNNKYEYDHHLWCFRLDRVIHHSMYYPCDYWFIPQTLSEDWDPCDICLLVTNPTFTWCLIKARPIWILYTVDNAWNDPKIIAVPTEDVDPRWNEVHCIDDLGHHMKEELLLLFKQIKALEHNKYDKIEVLWFWNVLEAQDEILTSIKRFQDTQKNH